MANFTINTTRVTGPFAWAGTAPQAFDTAAKASIDTATLGMCNPTQDRSVNYIDSLAAVDSLRPDHGAAKQAAPPRGNPR